MHILSAFLYPISLKLGYTLLYRSLVVFNFNFLLLCVALQICQPSKPRLQYVSNLVLWVVEIFPQMIRMCTTDTKCFLRQSPAQSIYAGHKFLTKVKLEIVTLDFGLSCEGPLPTPNLAAHAYLLLKSQCLLLAIHIRSRIASWVGGAKATCSKVSSDDL